MSQLSEKLKKEYNSEAFKEPKGCPPPKEYSDGQDKKDLTAFIGFMNTSASDSVKNINPGAYMGDSIR